MSIRIKCHFTMADELTIDIHDEYIDAAFDDGSEKGMQLINKLALDRLDKKLKSKGIKAFEIRATVKGRYLEGDEYL